MRSKSKQIVNKTSPVSSHLTKAYQKQKKPNEIVLETFIENKFTFSRRTYRPMP